MARSRRAPIEVPETPETIQPGEYADPQADEAALVDIGDVTQLADPKYREWLWWVYRLRTPEEMQKNPRAALRVVVTRILGPIDVIEIQNRFGGGVYEFWGYFDGHCRTHPRVELEGPRKDYSAVPASAAAPAPSSSANGGGEIAMMRTEMAETNKLLRELIAAKPAAPQGLSVKDVLELAPLLRPEREPRAPATPVATEVVKEMVGLFKEGMELRREVEGGDQGTFGMVLEKLAPSLERIATAVLTRRPPMRPPGVKPPREVPHEEATAAVPPATTPTPNHRWLTAVESMASAIAQNQEPGEFAITLEGILNEQEIAVLRLATSDQVIAECGTLVEQYPILKSDPARAFIDAVLIELKSPTEDASPASE
jgi:hypothetical protein